MEPKGTYSVIMFFLFLLLIVGFILFSSPTKKYTKEDLARYYKITKPTLGKWVQYFQSDIPFARWKKMRKVNSFEYQQLIAAFGEDQSGVMQKGQLAEKAESNYKTVRENIKRNILKIGITKEAWEKNNVFPPSISNKMLYILG